MGWMSDAYTSMRQDALLDQNPGIIDRSVYKAFYDDCQRKFDLMDEGPAKKNVQEQFEYASRAWIRFVSKSVEDGIADSDLLEKFNERVQAVYKTFMVAGIQGEF